MKKIKISLFALVLMSISIMSCEDQLTETVYSELLANNAYVTEADAEVLVLGAYAGLNGSNSGWASYYQHNYIQVSELPTDYGQDVWSGGGDAYETGTWDSNQQFILDLWSGAYKVVGAANFGIGILEGMDLDESVKNSFIGELKFLRALAYYDLTFNFKDVILNVTNSSENLPVSPQADIIAHILKDLGEAISVLPNAGVYSGVGRATKDAAIGLRAKVHLNAKNWAEAAADANTIIGTGDYDLFPAGSLVELYDDVNRSDNEWIFVIQSETSQSGATNTIPWFALSGDWQRGGWGNLRVSNDFYKSFDLNDERRGLIANGFQDGRKRTSEDGDRYFALPGTPEYDALAVDTAANIIDLRELTSMPFIKYSGGHDRFEPAKGGASGTNYPILRYADILLTRAEALNETGDQPGAIALVNQVRTRAGIPVIAGLDQTALRDAILEERAKELFMEGHRRLDLIRSGKYIELWKAGLEGKYPGSDFSYLKADKTYFPIPQVEVDANDQINPGD